MARRSAALVAACLAGLLKQIGRDGSSALMQPTTIAVDGGLFEHYQAYRGYLRTNLDQLLGRQVSCLAQLSLASCTSALRHKMCSQPLEAILITCIHHNPMQSGLDVSWLVFCILSTAFHASNWPRAVLHPIRGQCYDLTPVRCWHSAEIGWHWLLMCW